MNFDKELFFKYLKQAKAEGKDLSYIYRLYKNFDLINSITNGDIKSNLSKLRKFEDSIYTINGKVLNDSKRIKIELENIYSKVNEISNKELFLEVVNLEDKLGSMNLNDDVAQIYAKKQISILQAKLGLKNTFFLSAYEAFLEQYRNIYISSLTIDEDPVISK